MFALDKLVIKFIKELYTNSYMQFIALTGLWVISEIVIPTKKVKK